MRKPYVLLLALTLVLVAANAYMFTAKPKPKAVAEKLSYIVRLVGDNGRTFCSGTVISDHTIVTAAHCIIVQTEFGMALRSDVIGIRVDDNIDRKVLAIPLNASPQMDTALLAGDFRAFKHANYINDVTTLATYARPKQELKSCGFPLGGHIYCTNLVFKDIYTFMWSATGGFMLPGMSGGPVFINDLIHGESVVAVNTAMDGNLSIVSPIYNLDLDVVK